MIGLFCGCTQVILPDNRGYIIDVQTTLAPFATTAQGVSTFIDDTQLKIEGQMKIGGGISGNYQVKIEILYGCTISEFYVRNESYKRILTYHWKKIGMIQGDRSIKTALKLKGEYCVILTNLNNTQVKIELQLILYELNNGF